MLPGPLPSPLQPGTGEEEKKIISSGSPPFDYKLLKTQKCALFVLASPVPGMGARHMLGTHCMHD